MKKTIAVSVMLGLILVGLFSLVSAQTPRPQVATPKTQTPVTLGEKCGNAAGNDAVSLTDCGDYCQWQGTARDWTTTEIVLCVDSARKAFGDTIYPAD